VSTYPTDVQQIYVKFNPDKNNINKDQLNDESKAFLNFISQFPETDEEHIDLEVTDDDRFRILMSSKLFDHLLRIIRTEISNPN
jgi:hypothetical protein